MKFCLQMETIDKTTKINSYELKAATYKKGDNKVEKHSRVPNSA